MFLTQILLFAFMIASLLTTKNLLALNLSTKSPAKSAKSPPAKLEAKDKDAIIASTLGHVSKVFAFVENSDGKFMGLLIFLLSNVLTGIVNLSINTLSIEPVPSVLILCIYALMAFALPFAFHSRVNLRKSKSN